AVTQLVTHPPTKPTREENRKAPRACCLSRNLGSTHRCQICRNRPKCGDCRHSTKPQQHHRQPPPLRRELLKSVNADVAPREEPSSNCEQQRWARQKRVQPRFLQHRG